MRKCYVCQEIKDFTKFNKDKTQIGGFSYECKECKSAIRKKRRQENPEHYKEQQRKNLEKNLENIRISQRQHFLKNKDKINLRRRESRKNNKVFSEKDRARRMTIYAIKIGHLKRPKECEKCMKKCKPEAHHEDYAKPLEVNWLCFICHCHKHGKLLRKNA